jgi:hypothetical protein
MFCVKLRAELRRVEIAMFCVKLRDCVQSYVVLR